MPSSIVVLSEGLTSSPEAVAYAEHLAKTMAVPLRLLRVPPRHTPPMVAVEAWSEGASKGHAAIITDHEYDASTTLSQVVLAALAEQDALLLVMQRLPGTLFSLAQFTDTVQSLLLSTHQPLLLVPMDAEGHAPPLRIALVADGDPFTLVHGQRAMHALFLTLPLHITVLHAPMPFSRTSVADALQSVLACGLAVRYPSITTLEMQAESAMASILMAAKNMQADLIILIIRSHTLFSTDFGTEPIAALFQQSPIPVLLLMASDA